MQLWRILQTLLFFKISDWLHISDKIMSFKFNCLWMVPWLSVLMRFRRASRFSALKNSSANPPVLLFPPEPVESGIPTFQFNGSLLAFFLKKHFILLQKYKNYFSYLELCIDLWENSTTLLLGPELPSMLAYL